MRYALLALLTGLCAEATRAQSGSTERDSLRFYELSEIVVGGTGDAERVAQTGSVRRVQLAEIVQADAPSVAGLVRLVPSAHLQTNSRGESLIYLRSSGERQVAVFLDGALLNVPWDNRVDLSAIPSSVLGGMQVSQGASSVLYGANVLGGAVNLSTRSLAGDGALSELTVSGGSGRYARVDGMHVRRRGAASLLVAAGLNRSDGFTVGENVALPFAQTEGALRTNTDRRIGHGYIRIARRLSQGQAGLSLFHVDTAKGVAPEGHVDPSKERVRYWRYPDWRLSMLTGNLDTRLAGTSVRGAAWVSLFGQTIHQYPSARYGTVVESQEDRDRTLGFRVTAERSLAGGVLRSALNGMTSAHRQVDRERDAGGLVASPAQSYRQVTASFGMEYGRPVSEGIRALLGANVDGFWVPDTAGKPGQDRFSAWGATSGLEVDLSAGLRGHLTVGRKVRFPTVRELFGTALNRFVINDYLKPESAVLIDAGIRKQAPGGELEVTAFANRTWDTIDQRNVTLDGDRFRQRINLSGSRVLGVEIVGRHDVREAVEVDGSLTIQQARVLGQPGRERLVEKPGVLGTIQATVTPTATTGLSLEAVYTGRAYGLDMENELTALPRVLQWNARASVRTYTSSSLFAEVFVRGDNLTDQSVFPQLGLPGPGRSLRLGVSLAY